MLLPGELPRLIPTQAFDFAIFRFSSSHPDRFSPLRSDGSTTLLDSSSEKYTDSKPLTFSYSVRYVRERSKSWKTLVKTEDEKRKQMEEYRVLLEKLVKTKMHSESETSKIDSFKDLRVDIRNELSELKSMMAGCQHCSTNLKAKDSAKVWESEHRVKFGTQ